MIEAAKFRFLILGLYMQYKRLYREIWVPAKENRVIYYLYIHIDWICFWYTPQVVYQTFASRILKKYWKLDELYQKVIWDPVPGPLSRPVVKYTMPYTYVYYINNYE